MFSGLMVHAWIAATVVAVVAGVVGFFVVVRGASFVAHAIPQSGFAGAAGAGLIGVDSLVGLAVFALVSALTIGWLGRRGRHDVVTALAVVMMLGLGALFLSWSQEYAPELYALLFGEILGVTTFEIVVTVVLAILSIAAVAVLYRPLLLSSVVPEVGEAHGVPGRRVELLFLVVVAMVTTTAVPVVGALLMFSLMIGPPAAARSFVRGPAAAIALSVAIALATVWASVAGSYATNWPIGFFVGAIGAGAYVVGRVWAAWQTRRGIVVTPGPVAVAVPSA
jgi:zinc/manganese transport system permease protein